MPEEEKTPPIEDLKKELEEVKVKLIHLEATIEQMLPPGALALPGQNGLPVIYVPYTK